MWSTMSHVHCVADDAVLGYLVSGRVRDTTQKVRKAPFQSISIRMRFIDVFTLILSFLGVYGIVYSLRLLLPRNIVSLVSTSLNETMALLGHAEAINIPNMNDYRANLAMYARGCTQLSSSTRTH